jgi:hypothetical protein
VLAEFLCLVVLLIAPAFEWLLLLINRGPALVIVVALESVSVLAVALLQQAHRVLLYIGFPTL